MFSIIMINSGADCRFTDHLARRITDCTARTLRSGDDRNGAKRLETFPLFTLPLFEADHPIVTLFSIIFHLRRFPARLCP